MAILALALKSLLNRKFTFLITLFSIAISIALILSVQTLKDETKSSFMKSISGTDLIIGARGASSQLLLSSVFHIGNTTNTIKYDSFKEISQLPAVEWAIPISLGDSHKGYTVMATELSFFEHFSYANKQSLSLASGKISDDMFAVVIGADVANKLNYKVGDSIIVSHGSGEIDDHNHDDIPFFISAILAPSFTAIDQTLVISLEAMEAMHTEFHSFHDVLPATQITNSNIDQNEQHNHAQHEHDEHNHVQQEHEEHNHAQHEHEEHNHTHYAHADYNNDTPEQRIARLLQLKPEKINALFVGLTSRQTVLGVQNFVNNYPSEPLTAIMPAVALQELWSFFAIAEVALNIVTAFVVLVGLLGMLSIILMSLNERRREMAILRSVGARPSHIFALIIGEACAVCFSGILLGIIMLYAMLFILQAPLADYFGFYLEINLLGLNELYTLMVVQLCALIIAIIPGVLIYKTSLSDGMNIKF